MRTKIYTKTGDKGQTGLIGNQRVSKSDARLEVYGTLDELNAVLGLCLSHWQEGLLTPTRAFFLKAQHNLFNVGSRLACADEKMRGGLPGVDDWHVRELEEEMDRLTADLPELKSFILPGGTPLASFIHQARTVCRRAERNLVAFYEKNTGENEKINVRYLNRLSDFLFVAARAANHAAKVDDILWRKE